MHFVSCWWWHLFNSHFRGQPGYTAIIMSPFWMIEVVVTTGAIGCANCSQIVTNKPTRSFYRLDALPVAQSTVSKCTEWKKHHISQTCSPEVSSGGSSNLVLWPLKAPGYLGTTVAEPLVCHLTSVHHVSCCWFLQNSIALPSVLCHCWLGDMKGIWPITVLHQPSRKILL